MKDKHPPADRRCQVYLTDPDVLLRCRNEGTHWEKWGGCGCEDPGEDICEGDFYSWECDGAHDIAGVLTC